MTRVALGGLWHETNTFVPGRTELADFRCYQYAVGSHVIDLYAGTGTEIGGALAAARPTGVEVVPLAFAAAVPSGLVSAAAFDELLGQILGEAERATPVDAAVLCLHGAMVVEGREDPECEMVAAVREVFGGVPIAVTLDLHGNIGAKLAETADVLVGYDTYPHIDMAERGAEAMTLAVRMLASGDRPERHLVKLPLLSTPQMQETATEPMRSLYGALHEVEGEPGVWTASLLPGFPYADTDRLGFSVYVAADCGATERARALAELVWERREDLRAPLLDPDKAVYEALAAADGSGPIVLVDVADNVGGGSPGDGTVVLASLQAHGASGGAIVIWDPVAVGELYASDSQRASVAVGGRSTPDLGAPVVVSGRVRRLERVTYSRSGSYMGGQLVDMGRVAIVEAEIGDIVVTERRVMPFDDDHLRVVGVRPDRCAFIVTKSAVAWKAAFGAYAKQALYVRTPGYCPSDLGQLVFSQRPTPIYPLERDARWP